MKLTVGQTLHSVAGTTVVVVIRAPVSEVTVTCGGEQMTGTKPATAPVTSSLGEGPEALLGKRYADQGVGIELLCTKSGGGPLCVDGRPLPLKDAKPLPASD